MVDDALNKLYCLILYYVLLFRWIQNLSHGCQLSCPVGGIFVVTLNYQGFFICLRAPSV